VVCFFALQRSDIFIKEVFELFSSKHFIHNMEDGFFYPLYPVAESVSAVREMHSR
jgi:hypothetical protein